MRFYYNSKILYPVLLAAASFILASIAVSQTTAPEISPESSSKLEQITNEISATVMSPFCPGRTLSSCPSPQARELRVEIFSWLKSGLSPEEVEQRLINIYGSDVRGAPEAVGVGLFAWIMPAVFLLILAAAVLLVLRRLHKDPTGASTEQESINSEYFEQVESELKQRMV